MVLQQDALRAARDGELALLRALLEREPGLIHEREAEKPHKTLLCTAATSGQHAAVALLINWGAVVDETSGNGLTALAWAARDGHVEAVRVLCDARASLNMADGLGLTPFMKAIMDGQLETIKLLSSYGASRACDPFGRTAEQVAAARGSLEIWGWLVKSREWTPLHHIEQLTPERVAALLREGASIHAGSPSPLQRAREVGGRVAQLVVQEAEPRAAFAKRAALPLSKQAPTELSPPPPPPLNTYDACMARARGAKGSSVCSSSPKAKAADVAASPRSAPRLPACSDNQMYAALDSKRRRAPPPSGQCKPRGHRR